MNKNAVVLRIFVLLIIISILSVALGGCEQKNGKTGQHKNPDPSGNGTNISIQKAPDANPDPTVTFTPIKKAGGKIKVKALYLTGWTVGNMSNVKHYIDVAKTTEINSYVIDIKDDDGYVGYESQIQAVREAKAWMPKYNIDKVIKEFHENNVHVIGRLVCFKDPLYSAKRADLAVKHSNGGLWRDNNRLTWLNPYNSESWEYLVDIAKEALQKGFDEIQFDYVRFPNDGAKREMNYGDTSLKKYEAIDDFLAYARKEMPGAVLSADVFGIICESPADTEDIGQNLEYIGRNMDYISPMVYPSHYAAGQIINKVTFNKPDLDPYGVVYNTLIKAKYRIERVEGYNVKIRPYLQDFTARWLGNGYYQTYGPEQLIQQKKAVTDSGIEEWILWDSDNKYSESALLKE